MFKSQKKLKISEFQSVIHFLIVASSLGYSYGTTSSKTFHLNLGVDPLEEILNRGTRRPRQVEKLHKQSADCTVHDFPRPLLVLGSKKIVYISCKASRTVH